VWIEGHYTPDAGDQGQAAGPTPKSA